jgi:hypothetical protein
MLHQAIRRVFAFTALTLVCTTIAFAQSSTSDAIPAGPTSNTWQFAQTVGISKHKIIVVTLDQPQRRQTCHIQTFTMEKLVCSRGIGSPRTYLRQQVLALILPGDMGLKIRLALGLNGGVAVAIWGTVALAAACPACAVATGIAALLLFGAAGAILIGDDQPERQLYLAPGQQLTGKLRAIDPF